MVISKKEGISGNGKQTHSTIKTKAWYFANKTLVFCVQNTGDFDKMTTVTLAIGLDEAKRTGLKYRYEPFNKNI